MAQFENDTSIIDSSALLAVIHSEKGSKESEKYLDDACMSAINAAECLIVLTRNGMPADVAKKLIASIIKTFIPCDYGDIELINEIKQKNSKLGLSLADCICIALGNKLQLRIITADKSWSKASSKSQIICIR